MWTKNPLLKEKTVSNKNFLCFVHVVANVPSNLRHEYEKDLELVSKELNHLAAILHVFARGLIFMK